VVLRINTRPGGGTYDGTFIDDWEYIPGSGDLDQCNGMTQNGVYGNDRQALLFVCAIENAKVCFPTASVLLRCCSEVPLPARSDYPNENPDLETTASPDRAGAWREVGGAGGERRRLVARSHQRRCPSDGQGC